MPLLFLHDDNTLLPAIVMVSECIDEAGDRQLIILL